MSDKPYFVIYYLPRVSVWGFKRNSLFMVVLIYWGAHGCPCTREGGIKINKKKMCAEVILSRLLHVVECIVPFSHPRPHCLAEHWSTSADNHMKGLFVRSHFSPKPDGCGSSMLAPVVHYRFKLRLYALGHRALTMKYAVREAMKALVFFYLVALCCWWFGPQMLLLRNSCMSLADVSYSKALVSSISSASGIGVPAWWDVKGCRHLVSTSEQVRELKLTLVIIFGHILYFWKGQRWQLGIIGIHL